jgi:trehalose 6-phosphate phosphatase
MHHSGELGVRRADMTTLPPIADRHALFLDFDGTLAELAPTPDSVRVAPELIPTLAALSATLDGALAVVSGRRIADLDHFLSPLRPALAAEHGAQLRFADGHEQRAEPPDLAEVLDAARRLAAVHEGLLVEQKSAAVALHYRAAPHLGELCHDTLDSAVAARPGLQLLHGKFVLEVKPAGIDKGSAIARLMASAPFAGRQPVFAGDDVTDEAGFAWVQAAGGVAIKVGEGPTLALHACESPAQVREWLQSAVARLGSQHRQETPNRWAASS